MTTHRAKHPQLRNAPIVEAVFEMRFRSDVSYGLLPGRLFDALQADFPETEDLDAAALPLDLPVPNLVRHRFKSMDGKRLYQTGNGVVSVNHTSYVGFDDLRADVQKVGEAVFTVAGDIEVGRLGLRYINRMPLDREWAQITTAREALPPSVGTRVSERRLYYSLGYDPDRMNLALADIDVEGARVLQLDLDYFREREVPSASREIMAWVDAAHDEVHNSFVALLTDDYLREIS